MIKLDMILIVLWRNRAYLHHPHKDPNNKKLIKLAMSAKWEKKHESADLLCQQMFHVKHPLRFF